MRIIKADKFGISEAAKVLKSGGVIVYPTDTAYALGGIFNSVKVKNKILKIKNRRDDKFTIIASSLNQVENFFKLSDRQRKIAKKHWPAALSVAVSPKYAVRVPKNEIAVKLSRLAGSPLIATSANLSGNATLYDSLKIIKEFKDKKNQPDLIIDFGRLKKIKTSTIIKVYKDNIDILRQGSVKI